MIKIIKKAIVITSCVLTSPLAPVVAIAFYIKEKDRLFYEWHPLAPIIEPIYVGIAWPYLIAVEKEFIKRFGPSPKKIEQKRKKALEKEKYKRFKKRNSYLSQTKIKEKEKEIRIKLLGD